MHEATSAEKGYALDWGFIVACIETEESHAWVVGVLVSVANK